MRCEIKPANIRDVSWIAANLRDADKDEVFCQVKAGTRPEWIAAASLSSSSGAWVAHYKGFPTVAFGFGEVSAGVLLGWAYGREGAERCIPAITRWVYREMVPIWEHDGINRIEVRTIETHTQAHRWLEAAGATFVCELERWGRNGERFLLYEWVRGEVPREAYERWQ